MALTDYCFAFSVLQRPPGTPVVGQDAFFFFLMGCSGGNTHYGELERLSKRVQEASKGFGCRWVVWRENQWK